MVQSTCSYQLAAKLKQIKGVVPSCGGNAARNGHPAMYALS